MTRAARRARIARDRPAARGSRTCAGAALQAAALASLLALGGCGQRGPLSLPERDTPPADEAPAGSEPESDDDER